MAEKPEDKRRIEEEKRRSLRSTEVEVLQEKPQVSASDASIDFSYFKELLSRRVTFGYDACRVLVVLLGVEQQYRDIDSQISFLKQRNIIPENIAKEFNPNEPLCKGLAAYMFCQALEIKGGIWMRIFGVTQRYALKELVYEGIILPGTVNDIVSGKELILMLTNSAEYLADKR